MVRRYEDAEKPSDGGTYEQMGVNDLGDMDRALEKNFYHAVPYLRNWVLRYYMDDKMEEDDEGEDHEEGDEDEDEEYNNETDEWENSSYDDKKEEEEDEGNKEEDYVENSKGDVKKEMVSHIDKGFSSDRYTSDFARNSLVVKIDNGRTNCLT